MLVSLVLPTFNRARFIPDAIRCFLHQDYPDLELVIVDSGTDETRSLIPSDARIKYLHSKAQLPCGAARNLGTEHAKGEIILNTDSDDFYSYDRVSRQVAFHMDSRRAVTGYSYIVMHDVDTDAFNRYTMAAPYTCGPTICFTRSYWENHRIQPINEGEDWRYVRDAAEANESARNDDDSRITVVARTHKGNTISRELLYSTPQWVPATRPPDYFYDLR